MGDPGPLGSTVCISGTPSLCNQVFYVRDVALPCLKLSLIWHTKVKVKSDWSVKTYENILNEAHLQQAWEEQSINNRQFALLTEQLHRSYNGKLPHKYKGLYFKPQIKNI